MEQERKLKEKMNLLQFLALAKFKATPLKAFESKDFKHYKKKCKIVAKKIEKWHKRVSLIKKGSFLNDEEFEQFNPSPVNFSDNSDEEQ